MVLSLAVASCSKASKFTVEGEIENLGDRMVEMDYYDGHGWQRVTTSTTGGHFMLEGSAEEPTMVALRLTGGDKLVDLLAENGDKLKIKMDFKNPASIEISGNDASRDYGRWMADNAKIISARNVSAINRSVADYVGKNRESMTSTLLLLSRFYMPGYEAEADSLLQLIDADARPAELVGNINAMLSHQLSADARGEIKPMNLYSRRDSTYRYYPDDQSYTLFVFSDRQKIDTLTRPLKDVRRRLNDRQLAVIEVSLSPDSVEWRRNIASDSATWVQTWAPGAAAAAPIRRLAIPRVPFFIVADSTGRQLYRGTSVSAALKLLP